MANVISTNPIYVDTLGVITTAPLWIKKIVLVPNAHSDAATLKYWVEHDGVARVDKQGVTVAVSGTNTITATGEFVAAAAVATDAIRIYKADLAANVGTWEIATVASDDAITVAPAITNDVSGVYSWKTFPSYPLATMKSQATSALNYELNFSGKGLYAPNLMVTALSTSVLLYIYL
jgi:hypothetical protein